MRTNPTRESLRPETHEGAPAHRLAPEKALRRSLMACLLWEKEFYEDGEEIGARIRGLAQEVDPEVVFQLAIEAREEQHLRHAPLWVLASLAEKGRTIPRGFAEALTRVISRPDEIMEFLALYWKAGKRPIAWPVRKGLAGAFGKFTEYSFAKYDQKDRAIRLRDVMFLVHPEPVDEERTALYKKIADDSLEVPDTWEVGLSREGQKGKDADKRAEWTRLLEEKKLGPMALIRNLRNMQKENVDLSLIRKALVETKPDRVLPFRFISAAKAAPQLEPELETMMLRCLGGTKKLAGRTVLLVDVSGSMTEAPISVNSDINRLEAAAGLTILLREVCEDVAIYAFSFATDWYGRTAVSVPGAIVENVRFERHGDYPCYCMPLPPRHGFALRDLLNQLPHSGTPLGWAIRTAEKHAGAHDRLIVLTDEQSHDSVSDAAVRPAYMVNVASAKNGVGYGAWTHVDGWSESIVRYIQGLEGETAQDWVTSR